MANYSTLKAAVAAVVKTNGEQAITGANMQTVLLSIINSIGGGYIFEGVATPSTNAGTPDQNVFYIGGAGTYANFGASVVVPPTNIAVFKYNGSWVCEQVTVENGGVFDISAFHAVGGTLTTYADLAAALGTNGANVPEGVRKGGMSVKFVHTYDNKYVQYRYMLQYENTTAGNNAFKNVGNWIGVGNKEKDFAISSANIFGESGILEINGWYDNGIWNYLTTHKSFIIPVCPNDTLVIKPNSSQATQITFLKSFYLPTENGQIADLCATQPIHTISSEQTIIIPSDCRIVVIGSLLNTTVNAKPIKLILNGSDVYNGLVGYINDAINEISDLSVILEECNSNLSPSSASYTNYIFSNIIYFKTTKYFIAKVVSGATTLTAYKVKPDGAYTQIQSFSVSDGINVGSYLYKFVFSSPVDFEKNEYLGIKGALFYSATSSSGLTKGRYIININDDTISKDGGLFGYVPDNLVSDINAEKEKNKLDGKVISVLGDSISTFEGIDEVEHSYYPVGNVQAVSDTWWGQIIAKCGAIKGRINAIGGSCIAHKNNEDYTCFDDSTRYSNLFTNGATGDSPDIIIVFGGVNDWVYKIPIGDANDSYENPQGTTLYAALRNLIVQLQTIYTNAYIYVLTPIRNWYYTNPNIPPTRDGVQLKTFVDAIKDCCQLHGAKCIDLYDNLNINYQNKNQKTTDTRLHPNLNGMTDIANYVISKISEDF